MTTLDAQARSVGTDVFISYSRRDKAFVEKLHAALRNCERDTWVDWDSIPLTADWRKAIEAGIEAANTFVFVISPDSVASEICTWEIDHSVRHNKRLVPIVRREGFDPQQLHPELSKHNWLYFQEQDDFDRAFQALIQAIDTDLVHVRAHTRLLVRALEWDGKGRNDSFLLRGSDLAEAEQWLNQASQKEPQPTEQQQNYISKSREAEDANQRLAKTAQKSGRMIRFGSVVLGVTLTIAAVVGVMTVWAFRTLEEARIVTRLEREGVAALQQFQFQQSEALLAAMRAGQALKELGKNRSLEQYSTATPLLALQTILNDIQEHQLKGHQGPVYSASFSPDGQTILTASADNTARLWDRSGKQLAELKGHQGWVTSASFSPDGQTILTASRDKTAHLWDRSGKQLAELKGHQDAVWSASFSSDGQTILTASYDNTARLWDRSGKQLAELKGHQSAVTSASFSPDGQTILTASYDNTARLWDRSGEQLAELKGHQSAVTSASFSPDGQTILTASDDGTARLWDRSGKQLAELKGHQGTVTSASFSPDGQTILTASGDNTARLWDRSGKQLAELKGHQDTVWSASFSPDGQTILTASADGTARVWPFDNLDKLLARGCQWLEGYLISNPQELATLRVCQTQANLLEAAPFLVKEAETQAKAGDVKGAVGTLRRAMTWDPSLTFNLEAEARQLAAPAILEKGKKLVEGGSIEEALAAYTEARKLDPTLKISAQDWDSLCWFGSLSGHAAEVLDACEKAVAPDPKDGEIRNSRGLARALTGNTQGAIEDFQAFIAWTDNQERKARRQRWIAALEAGKNPFTKQELESLRNQ
ncbi:TIR domain-containing protein [Leptolyngbya sp. FACHB-261]|uniref:TIR domain-containing protein n=1 Tax=Leptolyngbya sp. FACHB-261 TaxID=2692806 RepID=UPI00168600AD|nr:TIR domain-containing protein [Leptolyngbya sp. FACHB-261]MBD2100972.1 TIR domain-containing protein [Leptolyngbya sp. FACHB-261]